MSALLLYLEIAAAWGGNYFLFLWWCTVKSSLLPPATNPEVTHVSTAGRVWACCDNELFLCLRALQSSGASAGRCLKCVFSINCAARGQLIPLMFTPRVVWLPAPMLAACCPWVSCGIPRLSACSRPLPLPPCFCTRMPSATELPGFPRSPLLPSV